MAPEQMATRPSKRPRIQELTASDANGVAGNAPNSRAAALGLQEIGDDEDDLSSELSTSSSEPSSLSSSSEDDDEDEQDPAQTRQNLRRRIAELLPRLKAANSTLDSSIPSGFEVVDEGEAQAGAGAQEAERDGPLIEMDLGLGVLEEQRTGDPLLDSSSSEDEDDDDDDDDDDNDDNDDKARSEDHERNGGHETGITANSTKPKNGKSNVLGRLMGQRDELRQGSADPKSSGIQEI